MAGGFLRNQKEKGLKYNIPDINKFDKGRLSKSMIHILSKHMDMNNQSDEMKTLWEKLRIMKTTL